MRSLSGFSRKGAVEKLIFERGRQFRDGLITCARRIAPEVASNDDITEVEKILTREFRSIL